MIALTKPTEHPAVLREGICGSEAALSVKPKRNVRFNDALSIRELPASEPLTKEQKRMLWYRKKDFTRFGDIDKKLARDYRFAKRTGQSVIELEVRGLENQLSIRANLDARARLASSRRAVLGEQARQQETGMSDPRLIRKASVIATRPSRVLGFTLAKKDAFLVVTLDTYTKTTTTFFENKSISCDKSPVMPRRKLHLELREDFPSSQSQIEPSSKSIVVKGAPDFSLPLNQPYYAF